MGEAPRLVINTGAIGVYNIMHEQLMGRKQLEESVGITLPEGSMLVTYHPATLDDEDPATHCDALLQALDRFPDSHVIITYPNNDSRGRIIIDRIEAYAKLHPERVKVIPSLGKLRYLSALRCVSAVVGNSSSGIVRSTLNGDTDGRHRHAPTRTPLRDSVSFTVAILPRKLQKPSDMPSVPPDRNMPAKLKTRTSGLTLST